MRQITVAVTSGDPCGVGPEVILKAFAVSSRRPQVHLIVIGDLRGFIKVAKPSKGNNGLAWTELEDLQSNKKPLKLNNW